jgi:hypothetical protein
MAKSHSPASHLEGMGLPLIAQQASESVTPSYFIHFDGPSSVTIKHMSQLGEKSRTFKLNTAFNEVTKDNVSVKQVLEMPSPHVLVNTIDWPGRGKIVDTKTLLPATGPKEIDTIHQRIDFVHRGGKKTATERIWYRGDESAASAAHSGSEARGKGAAGGAGGAAADDDE